MKKFFALLILCTTLSVYADDEISLFDSHGKPVAYLHNKSGKLHVYGFNGKHLGWFVKGIVYDHDGYSVGAVKKVFSSYVEYEPYKSYKPYKNYKEYAPFQPYLHRSWSEIPLKLFLLQGSK